MAENTTAWHAEWGPCTNEIEQFVKRRKRHRGLALFGKLAGGAAVGALLILGLTGPPQWAVRQAPNGEFDIGGITCSEVRAKADDFMAGRLDETTARRIRTHLRQCPHCGVLLERMRENNSALPPGEMGDGHQNARATVAAATQADTGGTPGWL